MKRKAKLDKHLKEYHQQSKYTEYVKEVIYGGNDGIITTLAVVNGFYGAGGDQNLAISALLLFAFANLFADGASMGLSNYLSERSELKKNQIQTKLEKEEIENDPELNISQTIFFLEQKGYSKQKAKEMTDIIKTNKEHWLEFQLQNELGISELEDDKLVGKSLATFLSFLFFGFLPIIPFVLLPESSNGYVLSIIGAIFALILLSIARFLITQEKWYKAVFETLFVGTIAGAIAYSVGVFFR